MSVGYRMSPAPGAGEVVVIGGGYEGLEGHMQKPKVSKHIAVITRVDTRTI